MKRDDEDEEAMREVDAREYVKLNTIIFGERVGSEVIRGASSNKASKADTVHVGVKEGSS